MSSACSEVENMTISSNYFEFLKQMFEDLVKYIKGYKNATNEYTKKIQQLHEKYSPRLTSLKEEIKKLNYIKTKHVLSFTSKIPKIISQQIANFQFFVSGIDKNVKSLEKTIKEKNSTASKYQNEYDETKNNLLKRYKEIEKNKNNFLSGASQAEDIIYKHYSNPNEKNIEEQMENNMKNTKKIENEYLNSLKNVKTYEDNFLLNAHNSNDNIKRLSCELSTKMKDSIVDFLLLLKNCFKLPLSEIDTYLPELIKLDENKKIEDIINSTYKKGQNFIPMSAEKYDMKLITEKMKNSEDDDKNIIVDENEILETFKKMTTSFQLINKDILEQQNNDEKLLCKDLTLKLLSFSPKIFGRNNQKLDPITENETENLLKLLEVHGNRVIFLNVVTNFRKYGEFLLPNKEYDILSELFNKILNCVKRDKDFYSAKNVIILSQTYYILNNINKIYLQNKIVNNSLFKEQIFWEELINDSLGKEIQKSVNTFSKNDAVLDEKRKKIEMEKYEKIIFAQLLPFINNMIEFNVSNSTIDNVLKPLIAFYKLKQESINVINSIIESKGIQNYMKKNKKKEEYEKKNVLSCIKEEEEDNITELNENIKKISSHIFPLADENEEVNVKMIKRIESEDDDEEINDNKEEEKTNKEEAKDENENINKVDEEKNKENNENNENKENKEIKENKDENDEINQQMIKDINDEEEDEEED